jgi:hypothetical protein
MMAGPLHCLGGIVSQITGSDVSVTLNELRPKGMGYNFVNGLNDPAGSGRYRMLRNSDNRSDEV